MGDSSVILNCGEKKKKCQNSLSQILLFLTPRQRMPYTVCKLRRMDLNTELSFNTLNYHILTGYLLQPLQQVKGTFHDGEL